MRVRSPQRHPRTVRYAHTPIRKERVMARYWYSTTPLVVVLGGFLILATPFLGLIALLAAALVALAALAWAIVYVPYVLGRSISRVWHARSRTSTQPAPALSPATHPERV